MDQLLVTVIVFMSLWVAECVGSKHCHYHIVILFFRLVNTILSYSTPRRMTATKFIKFSYVFVDKLM